MSEKVLRKNSVNRVCNERILSAYPVYKQLNLMREGGHELGCMNAWINAQRDACKVHELAIEGLDEDSLELRDYDIYSGWPDEVDAPEPEDTSCLEELEAKLKAAQEALDARPETVEPDFEPKPDEPPASIADLFQPDKPLAPQARALRELWLQIGHQIQRGEAKADEIRKHERLSSELEFINRHAFDGV
jgi:hypothetical protein